MPNTSRHRHNPFDGNGLPVVKGTSIALVFVRFMEILGVSI